MALTDEERELIRSSFRLAARNRRQAAAHFYEILFEQAPEARALFIKGGELMSKLGLIVADLQNVQGLRPVLEDLALRHVAYGVKPAHYAPVGGALVAMLAETLGDDVTPQTRAAWTKAYAEVAELMIRSAYTYERPVTTS